MIKILKSKILKLSFGAIIISLVIKGVAIPLSKEYLYYLFERKDQNIALLTDFPLVPAKEGDKNSLTPTSKESPLTTGQLIGLLTFSDRAYAQDINTTSNSGLVSGIASFYKPLLSQAVGMYSNLGNGVINEVGRTAKVYKNTGNQIIDQTPSVISSVPSTANVGDAFNSALKPITDPLTNAIYNVFYAPNIPETAAPVVTRRNPTNNNSPQSESQSQLETAVSNVSVQQTQPNSSSSNHSGYQTLLALYNSLKNQIASIQPVVNNYTNVFGGGGGAGPNISGVTDSITQNSNDISTLQNGDFSGDITASGTGTSTFAGNICAPAFYGDASHLTGLAAAAFSTSTTRGVFSTSGPIAYDNTTGIFSTAAGYNIPLTASTTNWENFYENPSTQITAGTGLSWCGNTLNSPWTQSGNDIYNNTTGNVGIGTTNPTHLLDLNNAYINADGSASFANGNATIDACGNAAFAGQTTLGLTPPGGVGADPNGLVVTGSGGPSNQALASFEAADGSNGFQFVTAGYIGTCYPTIITHQPGVSIIPMGVLTPTIFLADDGLTVPNPRQAWDGYSTIQSVGSGSFKNGSITLGNTNGSEAWINNDGSASFANGNATIDASGNLIANSFTTSGGTSSQFLKADGSVDSNTYLTDNQNITLSGDISGSGTTSIGTTLATVNSNTGSFGSSTTIPTFTVNGKGLITAAGTSAVVAPAGTLTGTTLASNILSSSLTSLGTLGNLTVTNAPTFSFLTQGSIPFAGASGLLSQNNSQLFWDNAHNRLGIGTTTPIDPLDVYGNIGTQGICTLASTANADLPINSKGNGQIIVGGGGWTYTTAASGKGSILFDNGTVNSPHMKFAYGNNQNFGIDACSGLLRIINNADEGGGSILGTFNTSGDFSPTRFINVGTSGTFSSTSPGVSFYSGNTSYKIGFDSVGSTKGYIRYNVDTADTAHGDIFSAGTPGSQTDLMLIRGDGKVGIGTDNPSQALSVCGNIFACNSSGGINIGQGNTASGNYSSAFGINNTACGTDSSTLGYNNTASGNYSSAFGFQSTSAGLRDFTFGYQNVVCTSSNASTASGAYNLICAVSKASAFGVSNIISANCASAFGLCNCSTAANDLTVGSNNTACYGGDAIAIGNSNTVSGYMATLIGNCNTMTQGRNYDTAVGYHNSDPGYIASSFGFCNTASGFYTLAAGFCNTASGYHYSNAVGADNTASARYSSAFGYKNTSSACYASAFGDCLSNSTASSTMVGYCTAYMRVNGDGSVNFSDGACISPTGVEGVVSDRNLKDNFTSINNQSILTSINNLPITEWNYIAAPGIPYIGPVAQDFYAAFGGLGGSTTTIPDFELGNIALVGVQALSQEQASTSAAVSNLELELNQLAGVSTSTDDTSSDSLISSLQSFGATIVDNVVNFAEVIIEKLTVSNLVIKNSSDVHQTGFVIYDRATGQPICVYFKNGVQQTEPGDCADDSSDSSNNSSNSGGGSSSGSGSNDSDASSTATSTSDTAGDNPTSSTTTSTDTSSSSDTSSSTTASANISSDNPGSSSSDSSADNSSSGSSSDSTATSTGN